jgi:hypothetical protein
MEITIAQRHDIAQTTRRKRQVLYLVPETDASAASDMRFTGIPTPLGMVVATTGAEEEQRIFGESLPPACASWIEAGGSPWVMGVASLHPSYATTQATRAVGDSWTAGRRMGTSYGSPSTIQALIVDHCLLDHCLLDRPGGRTEDRRSSPGL